jgi:hypothetical protein
VCSGNFLIGNRIYFGKSSIRHRKIIKDSSSLRKFNILVVTRAKINISYLEPVVFFPWGVLLCSLFAELPARHGIFSSHEEIVKVSGIPDL